MYVNAPLLNVLVNLLLNIVSDLLSFLEQVLQDELPAGVLQNGVGDFGDGHVEVLHPVVRVPSSMSSYLPLPFCTWR